MCELPLVLLYNVLLWDEGGLSCVIFYLFLCLSCVHLAVHPAWTSLWLILDVEASVRDRHFAGSDDRVHRGLFAPKRKT